MAATTETKTGKAKVTIGKNEKELQFSYSVVADHPSFEDLKQFLLGNGYQVELPGEVEEDEDENEEKTRGKKREVRSLTRALMYHFAQKNQQEARSQAVQEATDTAEAAKFRAAAELEKFSKRTDISSAQRAQILLAQRLATAETVEEKEQIMRELAAIL